MVRENQVVIAPAQDVYSCSSCLGRQFNSEHSLLQHCRYAACHQDEWCERCRWLFVSSHARQNHVQASSHHWDCHLCNYFDGCDRESLVDHLADEHDFCWDCKASFWSYERHRQEDHNRCADCSQEFRTRNELLMHEQVHMERDEECYGCDKKFKTPSGIVIHLESRTCRSGVTPAQIEEWAFEDCREAWSYTNHRSSRNKYRCPGCDTNFPKVSALLRHVESPACNEYYGAYSGVEALRACIEEEVAGMARRRCVFLRDASSDDDDSMW